jgi:hypothetical protein
MRGGWKYHWRVAIRNLARTKYKAALTMTIHPIEITMV